MNYLLIIYCIACFALCYVSIAQRLKLKNVEYAGAGALSLKREELFAVLLAFWAVSFLPPFLLHLILRKVSMARSLSDANANLLVCEISKFMALIFALYIYKYFHIKEIDQPWLAMVKGGIGCFAVALPIFMLVLCLWSALLMALKRYGFNVPLCEDRAVSLFNGLSGFGPKFLFSLTVVFLTPVSEELIFRCVLYRSFKGALGSKFAAIFISIIFAALHFNLRSLFPLYILSFLLIKTYERFGNILAPIAMHAIFNCNSLLLIILFKPQLLSYARVSLAQ
ncbi:MAG: CPBP family intramembrane metalloprotease [Puniceicoccales bacterium]|jgi:membrane protease YdiL (CAAX protease family)|nr:CPBP family intramembrane metalloprotease [Puniceicoccales bacterium]